MALKPAHRRLFTILDGQSFEDGLAVSPAGLVLAATFAIVIGLTAGVYTASTGLAPDVGGRDPRALEIGSRRSPGPKG